jgi:hypothetical protein
MRAAPQGFADVVHVRADIKPFAAENAEVDFGWGDPVDAVAINVDETRLALDDLSLPGEFVKGNATMFFCRNHRRQLIEIAAELFKRSANFGFREWRHRSLLNNFALSILGVGCDPENKRAGVFLIFAHEQILNFRPSANGEQEQTSGNGIEGTAMADFFGAKFSSRQCDDIVRCHFSRFVHQ